DGEDLDRVLRARATAEECIPVWVRRAPPADERLDQLRGRWAAARSGGEPRRGALLEMAELYRQGADIDWQAFHTAGARRISLPPYPFARDRHWYAPGRSDEAHPLVHSGDVRPEAATFESRWTGQEPLLADHVAHGEKTLPGVTYLELARAMAG